VIERLYWLVRPKRSGAKTHISCVKTWKGYAMKCGRWMKFEDVVITNPISIETLVKIVEETGKSGFCERCLAGFKLPKVVWRRKGEGIAKSSREASGNSHPIPTPRQFPEETLRRLME